MITSFGNCDFLQKHIKETVNHLYGSYECDRHSLLKFVYWSVEVQDLHDLRKR